jgi:flagellar hook-associated protein 2
LYMPSANFSGIASGIDSASLIDSILTQKRKVRIGPLEKKNTEATETNEAAKEIKGLLNKLKEKADKFRIVGGGGIQKGITSSNEGVASATVAGQAPEGSFEINVTQQARNGALSFNSRFSSLTSAAAPTINDGASAADRTLSFQVGTGGSQENIAIELTSSSTISDIVEQFNSQSNEGTASIINVGTQAAPSYALSISTKNSGTEKGSIAVSAGTAVASSGALASNTISQAQDAVFTLSGVAGTITKSTNTVTDLIQGVTLEIGGVGASTVKTGTDAAASTKKTKEFVDAYNEVLTFISENDTVTEVVKKGEKTNVFGSLSNTSLDESIKDTIRSALSGLNTSEGGSTIILADLGITTERNGNLKFDEDAFKKTLNSNPTGVESLLQKLGDTLGGTQGKIAQYTQFQGLVDKFVYSATAQISEGDKKISEFEKSLDEERSRLQSRFGRLESLIGSMNSQQASLSRLLR